jgi:NTP pyrophosphatase (non-canonical NTP hydrolase)
MSKKNKKQSSMSKKAKTLTFHSLRKANLDRCNKYFHKIDDWSFTDWACALAGEVGELCNFIKKAHRGQSISKEEFAKEIADIQCYLDLLAARMNINLADCVIRKFNEVSDRKNCKIKL